MLEYFRFKNKPVLSVKRDDTFTDLYLHECLDFGYRLEVQADVSSNLQKRNSFSSGSANFSIGEKSGTVSIGDNASTKALAGSIAGYR